MLNLCLSLNRLILWCIQLIKHSPLDFVIKFKYSSVSDFYESSYTINLKKVNFNDISLFLSNIGFDLNLNKDLSLDVIVDTFYEIVYHSFNLFVSKTKIYNNYSPVWANLELRNFIIKNKCAHKNINYLLLLSII